MYETIRLIAATASPRRHAILRQIGVRDFDVIVPNVEEIHDATDPIHTVAHNAAAKFAAAREMLNAAAAAPFAAPTGAADARRAAIIAADTLVFFQDRLIGKPRDIDEARQFLRDFSGRTQLVFTAVAMGIADNSEPELRVEASSVRFKVLSEEEITSYIQLVRPLDRAGAYDIDASGDRLIASTNGSYTNIMGLPREVVEPWLKAAARR